MARFVDAVVVIFFRPDSDEYLTLAEVKQRVQFDPAAADQFRIYGGPTYRQFLAAGGTAGAVSDWWFDVESELWSLDAVLARVRKDEAEAGRFHDAAGRPFREVWANGQFG
jgi:hypothetical protein